MIEQKWSDKVSRMLEIKAAAKAWGVEDKIQPIIDKIHDDMYRECREASVEPMSVYFMTTEMCKRLGVHPADFMHFCKQIIRHIDGSSEKVNSDFEKV